MKVRDLIDSLLDYASMDDEVVIAFGLEEDFDEYNTDTTNLNDLYVDKGVAYLFTGLHEGDNE